MTRPNRLELEVAFSFFLAPQTIDSFAVIFGLINLGFVKPGLEKVAIEIDSLHDGC